MISSFAQSFFSNKVTQDMSTFKCVYNCFAGNLPGVHDEHRRTDYSH